MTIGQINGCPVYMVTRKEVNGTPSAFMQAYDTWEEGTQKSQLSDEELNSLKKSITQINHPIKKQSNCLAI